MQYAASLDDCFENIAQGRASRHAFSKSLPQVQVTRCEHHYPADERVPHGIEAAPGRKPMRKGVPAALRLAFLCPRAAAQLRVGR